MAKERHSLTVSDLEKIASLSAGYSGADLRYSNVREEHYCNHNSFCPAQARLQLVTRLMAKERHSLTVSDLEKIASLSAGYSGADLRNVCAEASLGPIRSIDAALIERVRADDVRPLEMRDFEGALGRVRSSVSPADLERYPVLSITLTINNLKEARECLKKAITDQNIPLDLAASFLYYYFETIVCQNTETWKSYGVDIAPKDANVTPLSLLTVRQVQNILEYPKTEQVRQTDDPWMAIYVLGIYRCVRAKAADYKSQIAQRITTQMKSVSAAATDMTEAVSIYQSWENNRTYCTLVAAADMFFHRFPNHHLSNMRIGTTGSRYKDCAALMSLGYIMDLLGLDNLSDLFEWVFLNKIGDEIDSMMKENEELCDQYSYFPYQVDLGLVNKSKYSAAANPHFFEFIHLIGCLLRSQRSMNARHICDSQSMDMLQNSACVAYVYSHTFKVTKVYAKDEEELKALQAVEEELSDYDPWHELTNA
ncbi:unnamed protein product [Phaedon cochleariae]|uniref:Nucleoprotein n=1 Tax=Phaedon cochleariae TaxID=80249 RepID=A0A9N9SLE4_PHACE|nr:unnamed protein product [Phaedon cochleariae]